VLATEFIPDWAAGDAVEDPIATSAEAARILVPTPTISLRESVDSS
jgi:hypothetical protein